MWWTWGAYWAVELLPHHLMLNFFNIFIVIFASSKFVPICINKTNTAESFGPDNLIGGLKEAPGVYSLWCSLTLEFHCWPRGNLHSQPARAQNQNFKPHQRTQYTGGDRPCWEFSFKSCVVIARKVGVFNSLLHIEWTLLVHPHLDHKHLANWTIKYIAGPNVLLLLAP